MCVRVARRKVCERERGADSAANFGLAGSPSAVHVSNDFHDLVDLPASVWCEQVLAFPPQCARQVPALWRAVAAASSLRARGGFAGRLCCCMRRCQLGQARRSAAQRAATQ